jgi:DNA polymerase-4
MHTILHVDMDAFYAAVEQRDRPELRGQPVVVGSPPHQRGVVSTASYEARKFGVHSAMPSRTAYKLCPQAVFLPVRMQRYLEVSGQLMQIFESFTPLVEPLSCDEAFLDVAGALHRWKTADALAGALKQRVRDELGLTCSVGVAGNKFLAKLASDLHKPDGLTVVPEDADGIAAFLAPLPVGRIWGVGDVSEQRLLQFQLRTIGEVQRMPLRQLEGIAGARFSAHLHALAFGRDARPVVTQHEAKSMSSENTFDVDCADPEVVRQTLVGQAEHVGALLRRAGKQGRVAHLKLRWSDFTTITRQLALPQASSADRTLVRAAATLFEREQVRRPVRLVGFGMSGLDDSGDGPRWLFQEFTETRDQQLDAAVDQLRARFGSQVVRRASGLGAA